MQLRRADARAAAYGLDVPLEFSIIEEAPNLRKLTAKDRFRDTALLGLPGPSIDDVVAYRAPRRPAWHASLHRRANLA